MTLINTVRQNQTHSEIFEMLDAVYSINCNDLNPIRVINFEGVNLGLGCLLPVTSFFWPDEHNIKLACIYHEQTHIHISSAA